MSDRHDPRGRRLLCGDGLSQDDGRWLVPGEFVAVLSVGAQGDVVVPRSRDVHARVYFDGTTLFAQSLIADDPARLEGEAIGSAWTPLPFPCVLKLGEGRLLYEPLLLDETPDAWRPQWGEWTVVTNLSRLLPMARRGSGAQPSASTKRRNEVCDLPALSLVARDGETLKTTLDLHSRSEDVSDAPCDGLTPFAIAADSATVVGPGPVPAAVRHLLACSDVEPPAAPAPSIRDTAASSQVYQDAEQTRFSRLRAFGARLRRRAVEDFQRSGRSSRIALLGLPLIVYMALSPDVAPAPSISKPRRSPAPEASAAALDAKATPAESTTPLVQPAAQSDTAAPARPASAKQPRTSRGSGQPTLEARAAEAADRGAYAQAAGLYDQLARQQPGQAKFVSAARIFRSRASEIAETP